MELNIIEAKKISKSFNTSKLEQKVLDNISIGIGEGQFTVIMGASGAGKSTLLYALSGMDKVDSGEITMCSEEISNMSSDQLAVFRRKHCGFVFQKVCFLENLNLLDNILAAGMLVNKRDIVTAYAKELLEQVNVNENIWNKYPNEVSGGEAQRAGIVRALINKPEVVFADEPTGALNSNNGRAVLDVLTKVNEKGQSILLVTHDLMTAVRGERIIYIRDGKIFGECNLGKYTVGDTERILKLKQFLEKMGW